METDATVAVVDDDRSVRRALQNLLRSAGWQVEVYESADAYLRAPPPSGPSCLVLDVRLPGLSGIDLQRELGTRAVPPPIVFVTGHGDIAMAVHAIQEGAIEFLTKPFREQELLDAIRRGVDRHRSTLRAHMELTELQARAAKLTPREREVFELVVQGLPNKLIADRLDLTEATIKAHRGQVTRKLGASSIAELVTMAVTLGLEVRHYQTVRKDA